MTKWEYCAVSGIVRGGDTYLSCLIRFTPDGVVRTRLKKTRSESEQTVVAQTIAKLGEDGWEMVSAVSEGGPFDSHSLYFKRPKP